MHRNTFITIKLKQFLLPSLFCLFTISLLLFSNSNIHACKSGLNLWINNVVPSLLPFFIATELLTYTDIPGYLGKFFSKIMRPLFNVPGERGFCINNGYY